MPPIMAIGTDISMITKDLQAYRVRNLRQEKSLRDHGAGSDAGGAREVGGPGVDLTRRERARVVWKPGGRGWQRPERRGERADSGLDTEGSGGGSGGTAHARCRSQAPTDATGHHAPPRMRRLPAGAHGPRGRPGWAQRLDVC